MTLLTASVWTIWIAFASDSSFAIRTFDSPQFATQSECIEAIRDKPLPADVTSSAKYDCRPSYPFSPSQNQHVFGLSIEF